MAPRADLWPRLKLVPRRDRSRYSALRVAIAAIAGATIAAVVLFAAAGAPPIEALVVLFGEPLRSAMGLSETLLTATPLLLCALAVAVAYRVGLWNIGAEGQLYLGALAAAGVALYIDVPDFAALPVLIAAGACAGALWAALAAVLRIYARVNEILSTLMLNYVAVAWVELVVFGPWKGKDGFPYTAYIGDAWQLPAFFRRAHVGLFIAVGLAVALTWIARRTAFGYEVRVIGASAKTAHYAGISVAAKSALVMAVAGALAGLAGAFEISGVAHRLHGAISPGYGYTAIIIAFLARTHFLAIVALAFAFAALVVGGEEVQIAFPGVSSAVVLVLQGLLLCGVLIGEGLSRYRIALVDPNRDG